MATISLYRSKVNNMPSLIKELKNSVTDFKSELTNLKAKSLQVNQSICNLDDVINTISTSTKTQEDKVTALETFEQNCEQFISEAASVDSNVAEVVNQRKDDFYSKYYYLKPECEKSGWEKFCDGVKGVVDWCKDNWKSIAKIVLTITIIVALGIATALTGGVLGTILAGAFWGALMGGVLGGVMGGITSVISGGSFLEGFANGALTGAISGAITGAVCTSIGLAGQAFGKGISCVSKLGKLIKITSRVTRIISLGMDGFDLLAMGIGFFDPNNPLIQINQQLHSSVLYNGLQIGINALALFTGAAASTMKCFVAGTMILTASGLVAIENIKAGDTVISTNSETFEVAEKAVLETYVRETSELIVLTINSEIIKTTRDHPFFVKDVGFVNAGELYIGDKLLDANGKTLIVEDRQTEILDEPVKVYNFQVEDFHTYHVSENAILVHNANYSEPPTLPEFDGKKTEGVLRTADGKEISFESGGSSQYKNVSATHAEGKAAIYMRENGITEGTFYHNNPNGTCNYCDKGLPTLLPEGYTLNVVPPVDAVAPNPYWVDIPKTYTGNIKFPKLKP